MSPSVSMSPGIPSRVAALKESPAWEGFRPGLWRKEINVREFIQQNYEPYEGDGAFLAPATGRTKKVWGRLSELFVEERHSGADASCEDAAFGSSSASRRSSCRSRSASISPATVKTRQPPGLSEGSSINSTCCMVGH